MPRVSSDTSDTSVKAPRKRAVRRTITDGEKPVRRTRTTVASRIETPREEASRKAPTQFSSAPTKAPSSKKWLKALAVFVVVVGGATWLGFSDKGQIDVNVLINDAANRPVSTDTTDDGSSTVVPVQNTPPAAISGIRPRTDGGGQPAPAPAPEPTTEATTTEDSTEEAANTEETPPTEAASDAESSSDDSAPPTESAGDESLSQ